MSKEATELEYLEWFFDNADFGPAHEDVVAIMNDSFRRRTGKEIPKAFDPEENY